MATLNNGDEYQNWQFVKTRSQSTDSNQQQISPIEETTEDWNEAENDNQEEICPNNNISTRQRGKAQRRRPKSPITENCIKKGGGYIKNKMKIVPGDQTYAKTTRNIRKIGIIVDSHI